MRSILLVFVSASLALADGKEGVRSPDGEYKVTGSMESYSILSSSGTIVATDKAGYSSMPVDVMWSSDSRIVVIHIRDRRHSGQADIWVISDGTAKKVKATYPAEKGDFYFTAKKWLNQTDLEFKVLGKLRNPPDKENPFKAYTLVMRIDLEKLEAKPLRSTKPTYGHF